MKKLILVLMLLLGSKMSAVAETNGTEIFYNYGSIVTNLMDFPYLSYTNVFCGSFYDNDQITFTNVEYVAIGNYFMLNLNSNQMEIVKERFPRKIFTNSITIY